MNKNVKTGFPFNYPFAWVVVLCGVIALALMLGNLTWLGLKRHPFDTRKYLIEADINQGRENLTLYGCGGCHVIPGVANATGRVGPKLEEIDKQVYIGGVLANTPENMVRWLQDPKKISPETAMPNLGITEQEAKDMAAYLYQL